MPTTVLFYGNFSCLKFAKNGIIFSAWSNRVRERHMTGLYGVLRPLLEELGATVYYSKNIARIKLIYRTNLMKISFWQEMLIASGGVEIGEVRWNIVYEVRVIINRIPRFLYRSRSTVDSQRRAQHQLTPPMHVYRLPTPAQAHTNLLHSLRKRYDIASQICRKFKYTNEHEISSFEIISFSV